MCTCNIYRSNNTINEKKKNINIKIQMDIYITQHYDVVYVQFQYNQHP